MKGIKGTLIRGTQSIKQKLGKTDKTIDDEYQTVHNRTVATEKQAQNFSKHVNQLIENYHAMSTTLTFLAEDIRDLYSNADPNCKQRQMAEQLTRLAHYQAQIKSNVVEPSDEYIVQFPPLKDLHKKRENAVLEYDYFRDKVQKMSEKQNKDPLALPKAKEKMNQTREDFEILNSTSKNAMCEVLDRKDYVYGPAIEQLFGNIMQFYSKMAQETTQLGSLASEPRASSMPVQQTSTTQKTMYPKPVASQPSSSRIPPEFDVEFFYLDAELERHGPFSFTAMKQKFSTGEINADTYVFGGQMPDWTQISAVPNLRSALSN